jgi:hypothetical protein
MRIVCLVCLTIALPTWGQAWVPVAVSNDSIFYIDHESIRKEGANVVGWIMEDGLDPEGAIRGDKNAKSQINQIVINCATLEAGYRQATTFKGHWASGDSLNTVSVPKGKEDFSEYRPGSIGRAFTKAVCDLASRAKKVEDFDYVLYRVPNGIVLLPREDILPLDPPNVLVMVRTNVYGWLGEVGKKYRSAVQDYEINCATGRITAQGFRTYDEWHGAGSIVTSKEAEEVTDKTPFLPFKSLLVQRACASVKPTVPAKSNRKPN